MNDYGSSTQDMTGKAMTVKGPIDPSQLGLTLMHEHFFIENIGTKTRAPDINTPMLEAAHWEETLTLQNLSHSMSRTAYNRDNIILSDVQLAIEEATEFSARGGQTVVDVTNIGIRRDPLSLMKVSLATGLNIIAGSSWYVKDSYPPNMDELAVEDLFNVIVRDITCGIGDTGIRAGIIGEVGIQGEPVTENEIKVIRASARASRVTGAAITFHWGGTGTEKLDVADVVADEGGEMSRTIFGHSDVMSDDMPLMLKLLDRGVYIQFDLLGRVGVPLSWDTFSKESPWAESYKVAMTARVLDAIPRLIEAGYLDRILISQDVCMKQHLKKYGGAGYSFIQEKVLPFLRGKGLTEIQINQIMVENPKRALTFTQPK